MCVFHVMGNLKLLSSLLRFAGSLCLPCRNERCTEDRGHACLVQLCFPGIWQALSVCRVDAGMGGRKERMNRRKAGMMECG